MVLLEVVITLYGFDRVRVIVRWYHGFYLNYSEDKWDVLYARV